MTHRISSAVRSRRGPTSGARVLWGWGGIVLVLVLALVPHRASPAGELPLPDAPPLRVAVLPFTGQAPSAEYGFILSQALRDGLAQLRAVTVVPGHQIDAGADRLGIRLDGEPTDEQLLALGRALRVRAVLGGTYGATSEGVRVRPWIADLAGDGDVARGEAITAPTDTYLAAPQRILAEMLLRLDRRLTAWETQRIQRLFGDEPTAPEQYARYAQAVWAEERDTPEGHARALALLNQAVAADPNFALGHLALARILGVASRWTAIREVRTALAITPDLAGANRLLGDLLMAAPDRPYDMAMQAYQAALVTAPDDLDARIGLADARLGKGDVDGAMQVYRTAIAVEPRNARVHYGLGKLYYDEKGWYEKAVAELRQATALDPDLLDAWVSLGDIYEEKGLHEEAIVRYQHVLAVAPHHPGATYNLALTYEKVNVSQAIEAWTRYIAWAEQAPAEQEWVGIARKHLARLLRGETPPAR